MKCLVAIFAFLPIGAQAVTLDIDSLPGMPNDPGATVPEANRLSSQLLSEGVLVSSGGGFAAVVAENGNIGTGWKRNDPNVRAGLGGSSSSNTLSYATPIEFTFFEPNDASAPLAITSFSVFTDWFGDGSAVSLTAFDIAGNNLGAVSGNEHSGQQEMGTQFSLTGSNIYKVVVQGSSTTAFSNVQFAPVPEPATMAALGLGLAGLVRKRRK